MAENNFTMEENMASLYKDDISALTLTPRWQFDTYGMSTVTRSLVNNLRMIDPENQYIKITTAVLEEEGKIAEDQLRDANKHGVQLRGAKQPRGKKKKPELPWLNEQSSLYYQHLVYETRYDYIIGHLPYLADGCLNLKDLSQRFHGGHSPKVILIAHDVPTTPEGDADEELLESWLSEADVVLSVGDNVKMKLESCIDGFCSDQSIDHKLYITGFPLDFFKIEQEKKLTGEQNILLMTTEIENLETSGLDFKLAAVSSAKASQYIMFHEGSNLSKHLSFNLKVIASNEDERTSWEDKFNKIKQEHKIEDKTAALKYCAPSNLKKFEPHLKRATILTSPLKPESSLFGTEALVAMAASVPVLVSRNSGIASFLQSIGIEEPIIWDNEGFEKDVNTWKEKLIQKITKPEQSFNTAKEYRKQLLLDTKIASTHLDFVKCITDRKCAQLTVEISDAECNQEALKDAAVRIGLNLTGDPIDAKKYIVAFFHQLLLQREKLDHGLLADQLKPSIAKMWKEVLSCLEDRNRKLVGVESGCVNFSLFCPTQQSTLQLQDPIWVRTLNLKLNKLVELMGICAYLTVQSHEVPASYREPERYELPWLQQFKRNREQSECERHDTSSDDQTSTTSEDNSLAELAQEPTTHGEDQGATGTSAAVVVPFEETYRLVDKVELNHIEHMSYFDLFTASKSGAIAIVCPEGTPSLSMVYPGTDMPPLILSEDQVYSSALFIEKIKEGPKKKYSIQPPEGPGDLAGYQQEREKPLEEEGAVGGEHQDPAHTSNEERLAATCNTDNTIHVWNQETLTSEVVCNLRTDTSELMNLCVIDDTTVAYGDMYPKPDGTHKVYIMNTSTPRWSLRSTITLGMKNIWDMCFVKTADGTPCLVLSCPSEHCVSSIELVGGKTRWTSGEEEMGNECCPWSICTGSSNRIFVADFVQHKLFTLAPEGGGVIGSLNLRQFGIIKPFCVRVKDEFVYVSHVDKRRRKKQISKFTSAP